MNITPQPNEKMGFICYYYDSELTIDELHISLKEFATMLEPRMGKEKAEKLCGLTISKVMEDEDE